jgi:DNA polymerase III subunit gamma/tau
MGRTALARKYRPRHFGELSRQEHVAETLKSAVSRGRVAHAYLFSGPRGVGKTTAARVLAMALNCPNRSADGEPCGECESCERIWAGRTSLDVVEIDAASNRGVDDARELRERAMYAPTQEHRHKVYIIDEAHMLTREAWNALLKILEEPPPRVVFVFATTEPQKIQQAASPILSRCQRFEFRRIGVTAIVERLREVATGEGIAADDDALTAIAQRAEGGLRDALSLLDQLLSVVDGRLVARDVQRLLGIVAEERYLELFDILAEGRAAAVFDFVRRIVDEGYDPTEFYRGLADALRTRLIAKLEGAQAAPVRADLRPALEAQVARFSNGDLLRMLSQVAELDVEGRFRKSGQPRVLLETMLLRFAFLDRTIALEDLIGRVGGGAGPDPGPRAAGPAGSDRSDDRGSTGRPATVPTRPDPSAPPRRGGAVASGGAEAAGSADVGPVATAAAVASSPESAPGGESSEDVEGAFRRVLDRKGILPAGLVPFLRAAAVSEPDVGRVLVALPAGPGLERLAADATIRRSLESAIQEALGRELHVEIRDAGGLEGGAEAAERAPQRLTPERVRAERLARLAREEPALGRVVEEWDLELID